MSTDPSGPPSAAPPLPEAPFAPLEASATDPTAAPLALSEAPATDPTAAPFALSEVPATDPAASAAPFVPIKGRTLQGEVTLSYDLEGEQVFRSVEVWCPENQEAFREQTEPYIVSGDRRARCESMAKFWDTLFETVIPPMVQTLQQGRYPPMMDDGDPPGPLPYQKLNPKHPFIQMDTYYCKRGGPYSAILVFWYERAAPVVAMFPPSVVQEVSCGLCEACDPEHKQLKALTDLAVQQQARLGLPAPKT